MTRNGFTLKDAQRPERLAARRCFCVLLRAGKVEDQVCLDERSGWDMENRDFLVCVPGKVLELDLVFNKILDRCRQP